MEITVEHIRLAKEAKPCELDYQAGQNVQEIEYSHLVWVEDNLKSLSVQAAKTIVGEFKGGLKILGIPPLTSLAFSGYGYGYDGDGYGEGGYGYGYGYDGYGWGYNSGAGEGYGYGEGGYGYGYGYGYGGYGDGSGDGGE